MSKIDKGMWRLSVVVGIFGFLAFLFLFFRTDGLSDNNWPVVVSIGGAVAFITPFSLVQAIAWVIRGFIDNG